MAYALVLTSEKAIKKSRFFLLNKISGFFRGFIPAAVHVSFIGIDENLFLYIITMPPPEVYLSKNRIGKNGTLKKWMSAVKNNNIEHYLLERPLKEYMNGEWPMEKGGCLAESIRKNVHLLFLMEPLKELEVQTMTVTLSGAKKEYLKSELMSVLKNFKMVNVIAYDSDLNSLWDEFMAETGVPVCISKDFGVLSRTDIWISFEDTGVNHPFNGIKVDTRERKIVNPEFNKQYRIGYSFQRKLLKKLGIRLVQRFDNYVLSEFLLHMLINMKNIEISEAEVLLGVKISIMSVESLSLCS